MRVTSKGQVTIPKEIREGLGIKPGSDVEFVREPTGTVELRVKRGEDGSQTDSILKWADRVRGTLDLGGVTADEHFEWLRGPRDDLGAR